MKIEGTPKLGTPRTSSGTPARVSATPAAAKAPPAAQVDISGSAAHMNAAGDNFNAARVAEIRQAITEGRFQINPEKIADGLLASVRDMLGHKG